MPVIKIINIFFVLALLYAFSDIVITWRKTGVFPYIDCIVFLGGIIFMFYLYPRLFVKMIANKSKRAYGEEYLITFDPIGIQVNNHYITIKKGAGFLENQDGVALISFSRVIIVCTKKAFSSAEYESLKGWMKTYAPGRLMIKTEKANFLLKERLRR